MDYTPLIHQWVADKLGKPVKEIHEVSFYVKDGYCYSDLTFDYGCADVMVNGLTSGIDMSASEMLRDILKALNQTVK